MKGLRGAAASRGYETNGLRARQVSEKDFEEFHYILAMDRANLAILQRVPSEYSHKAGLTHAVQVKGFSTNQEVPDPYFWRASGFGARFESCGGGRPRCSTGFRTKENISRKREHLIRRAPSGWGTIHPTFYLQVTPLTAGSPAPLVHHRLICRRRSFRRLRAISVSVSWLGSLSFIFQNSLNH
jgi:hypothetical protein